MKTNTFPTYGIGNAFKTTNDRTIELLPDMRMNLNSKADAIQTSLKFVFRFRVHHRIGL